MWLNERRRGPGWSASSRPPGGPAAPLPPRPPPHAVRPHRPRAGRLPPGRCSSGASAGTGPRGPAAGPRRLAASGSRLRAGRARRAAAGAAPGSRPSGRTTLARGGWRRRHRAFEACGAPAGSPRRAARWSRPGCGKGAAPRRLGPRRPQQLGGRQQPERFIFLGPCTLPFPASPFSVSSCCGDIMALLILGSHLS